MPKVSRETAEVEDVAWLAPYVLCHRVSAGDVGPTEVVERAVQAALGRK